jgi:hypothetical protein
VFRRRPVVQNEVVARQMREFFRTLDESRPERVARSYGGFLWDHANNNLVGAPENARSRFHIGLSAGAEDFEQLTKRAALVSDTLLLCHDWTGEYHGVGESSRKAQEYAAPKYTIAGSDYAVAEWLGERKREQDARQTARVYGMHCPDLAELGRWLLGARGLLEAGLVWYLPSFSVVSHLEGEHGKPYLQNYGTAERVKAVDFLVRDGRAIDTSDVRPVKSRIVHPLLEIDLPFIDGVGIGDFSKITIEEFASYSAFRDFLRLSFLEMDETRSDHEVVKLGLQIKDQIRSARAEMERVRRKRSVAATGAVVGLVGAVLVAVYGPALAAAVAAIGAGGMWTTMNALAENSPRTLRENEWHYVWVLARKSHVA